ncbi:amidase [Achromobacter piechaudii]|uniref:2-amino-5-chloromuconic acid deaminase n=1 Tax=Achromobacter piechaudii TaxID=72556 RepID=A0ABN7EXF9_9BURK|nr:amidase [Achromobacter piechaudii]CAB3688329.1 2-amino-5-chloromuconic acid deaminase [Achromobacter piechaudii]CAB3864428.1 2-amino-5-chloromuconic acid deaminase [Achromobacter piechaudii]CAB3949116.1 2-amino-5-chloromuconic acid deaminase [Achromobacter piechaudii]
MVSTLNDLTLALSEGRTSSVALTELALARAQDAAGEGARVFTKLYAESALAQARASDTLRAAGIVRSAVEGLPISIKDLFDIEGETTMAGSVAREGEPAADENAEVVQRLIAAGAVIIGRTNMTEFAYSGLGINPHYGTPLNPYDRATGRIPGGSSSGAAVSVADGMAVAGIGSDTGGSVRIPAALCGLTGFKPSAWRVSMTGVLPLSANLDSIGPIAASVRCCAELDAILSGDGGPVPEAMSLRGLRLAVPTTLALDAMDKHVADTFAATVAKLKDAGALVDEIAIPEFAELGSINSKGGFTAAEAWAWHRDLIARAGKRYDPRVVSRIMRGQDMSAADYLDLLDAREAWVAAVDHRIAGYDALVMPTTPIVAPAVADLVASDEAYYAANGLILRNPTLINFLDGCALSLPCQAAGTAPVGLMISGSNGADRRILAVGLAVEALLAGH